MSWGREISLLAMGLVAPPLLTPADVAGSERAAAAYARELMVAVWPVDTGESLAGWAVVESSGAWWLYNSVEYVEYVHIQPEYGGPPGLADRRWADIFPDVRARLQAEMQRIATVREEKARQGQARGYRGGARLVRPQVASAAPAPRRVLDPLTSTPTLQQPPTLLPALSVPVAGATSVGVVPVVGAASSVVAESLMQPYIRRGMVDAVALGLIRAGRLAEAERRVRAQGYRMAADRLRDIIRQGNGGLAA